MAFASSSGLLAEPLDKPACEKLQSEKQSLVMLGVDREFSKGPDWAKANLAQAELNLLKRYIDIDEQLKFRCGLAMVTLQIPDDAEDGPDDDGPAASAVPMPERREAAMNRPAKPVAAPVKPLPSVVRPEPSPAAPAKAAPRPPAKAQSSWNAETAPVDTVAPVGVQQIDIGRRPDRRRPVEAGG